MSALCETFGVRFPLFQAGMGGVAGPALAAAVANAGAAGIVAAYKSSRSEVGTLLLETRELTQEPFGVNLIPELVTEAQLEQQIAPILAHGPGVFASFFGLPPARVARALCGAGTRFLVMVGTPDDAERAAELGASAVALQGQEAGGHLLGAAPVAELLREVQARALGAPLLVSGGVSSGEQFFDHWLRGASGCLAGSIFVVADEALAHPLFKERMVAETSTTVTTEFDVGWPRRRHRVLENPVLGKGLKKHFIATIRVGDRRYPVPRYSSVVPTTSTEGKVEEMVMYAGTSVAGIRRRQPVRAVVQQFIAEFEERRRRWVASRDGELRGVGQQP